jgi:hypothetical protein
MKKLIFITSLLIINLAIGQTKRNDEGVEYTIIQDDPYNLTPLVLNLDFLTADTWNTNSYMGINIRPEINIPKYGQINIDFRKAYLDGNTGESVTNGKPFLPDDRIKKHRCLEITAGINLFHSDKKKLIDVTISSKKIYSGSKKDLYEIQYIKVPGTKRTTLQARIGYQFYRAPIDIYELENDGQNMLLVGPDSTFNYKSIYGVRDGYDWIGSKTMMSYHILNVGLSLKTVTNLWVENKASKSGISGEAKTYDFYGDLLINTKTNFESLIHINGPYALQHSSVRKLGWRLGWSAHYTKGSYLTYKVEFGNRPTFNQNKKRLLGDNAFLLLSAGWSFGIGPKLKAKKEN